jgi:hypothetical protein
MPRIVRLGRPANDNHHRHGVLRGFLMLGFAAALLALVVSGMRLI